MAAIPGGRDLTAGLSACDLVAVQTARDAANLRGCLPAAGGRRPRVAVLPVGLDAVAFAAEAARNPAHPVAAEAARRLGPMKLVLGVDRLDYAKGVPERLEAWRRFLIAEPGARGRRCCSRSRRRPARRCPNTPPWNARSPRRSGASTAPTASPAGRRCTTSRALPRAALAGLHRLAWVGLVTPMRDGMNLVAKEFVAAQDPRDPGVLVLSRFAGAAAQLTDALIVNPYDRFEVAEAIREALATGRAERIARWSALWAEVTAHDAAWWADCCLDELRAAAGARAATAPAASA